MSSAENWLGRFRDADAIWAYPGHGPHASYDMASRHADFYFNSDIVAEDPVLVASIGMVFAQICAIKSIRPDWVISYVASVSSGIVIAAKLAELVGARCGSVDLRDAVCRFRAAPGEKILLVTDDIHSGASAKRTLSLAASGGGVILPYIFTLGNFSGGKRFENMDIVSLFDRIFASSSPDDCDLCRQGSEAVNARRMWHVLTGKRP